MSDPFANENYYDLVFVGRGYSVSTYLLMADLSWCKKICIISGPDAWSSVLRGEAGIINHALHVYGRQADNRTPQPDPTSRETLVDNNVTIMETALGRLRGLDITVVEVPGLVTSVARCDVPLAEDADIKRGPADDSLFSLSKKAGEAIGAYKLTYDEWQRLPQDNWGTIGNIENNKTITALKVVYGGGSGPHKVPKYLTGEGLLGVAEYNSIAKTITIPETPSAEGGILGLDAFMRLSASQKPDAPEDRSNFLTLGQGKKLALIGPNAGLDAAMEAVDRGFELIYLFGSKTSMPFWLETKHYKFENYEHGDAIDYVNSKIVRYDRKKDDAGNGYTKDREGLVITKQVDNKYSIKLYKYPEDGPAVEETIENVDFIIYSIGQSPDFTEILARGNPQDAEVEKITTRIGPAKVLSPILQREYLLPIYDVNQRFGHAFETALGLQTEGTTKYRGLEIIGAAAFAFTRGNDPVRKQPYVRQAYLGNLAEEMDNWIHTLDLALQPKNDNYSNRKKLLELGRDSIVHRVHLHDYLSEKGAIPSVRDTMMALVKKIHREGSVVMPEQLGGVRSQIEALTGFDLMATVSIKHVLPPSCEDFLSTSQSFMKKLKATDFGDRGKREELIGDAPGYIVKAKDIEGLIRRYAFYIGSCAKALIDVLSKNEKNELITEGVIRRDGPIIIVSETLTRIATLIEHLRPLAGRQLDLDNEDQPQYYDSLPNKIAGAIRWVTNVLVIMTQQPTTLETKVDFSGMDRNQLAVLLATSYSNIRPADWPAITDKIITGRDAFPGGYAAEHVNQIKASLEAVNKSPDTASKFAVPSA